MALIFPEFQEQTGMNTAAGPWDMPVSRAMADEMIEAKKRADQLRKKRKLMADSEVVAATTEKEPVCCACIPCATLLLCRPWAGRALPRNRTTEMKIRNPRRRRAGNVAAMCCLALSLLYGLSARPPRHYVSSLVACILPPRIYMLRKQAAF